MFQLRKIGVRVAVIDQRVQIFHRFPNAHLAAVQTENSFRLACANSYVW